MGFEIIDRDKTKVSFFYFTDENISEETFSDRLAQTEQSLWDLLSIGSEEQLAAFEVPTRTALSTGKASAVINAVDAVSALLGSFLPRQYQETAGVLESRFSYRPIVKAFRANYAIGRAFELSAKHQR